MQEKYRFKIKIIIKYKDFLFFVNKNFFRHFVSIECDYLMSIENIKIIIDSILLKYNIISEFNEVKSMKLIEHKSLNHIKYF